MKYVPGEVLVRFRQRTAKGSQESAHQALRANAVKTWRTLEGLELVRIPADASVEETIRAYRRNPDVLYAEPNYILRSLDVPSDPRFGQMWGLHNIGQDKGVTDADIDAPEAWGITKGSSNVVVAVIDSGIDYTHPDLVPNLFRNSPDCNTNGIDDDGNGFVDDCHGISTVYQMFDVMDTFGHGTHVAGTIGAVGDNAVGVAGVNWNVGLMACKFLDPTGNVGSVIGCLDYVRMMKDRGVNIVATNNSWGGDWYSQALYDAILTHLQSGILFIAAAGNSFDDNDYLPLYPASFDLPNIISVAATTRTDERVSFSNFGRFTVHLGAPGHDILSTTPGNTYSFYSGTSMAAPHVAGVAALLKAQDPTRDWRTIRNLILAGGDNNPTLSRTVTGKRLNAYGSLTCTNSTVYSRLWPTTDAVAGAVGAGIDLRVLNILCGQPNGDVTVTVSPGGAVITLLDDGSSGDQAAGDGVYSIRWVPPQTGSYTLTFPDGEALSVAVLENYDVTQDSFNYRTIVGTNLDLGDDSAVAVAAPFPISFGGGTFQQFFVSSNGTISFTDLFADFNNSYIPNTTSRYVTLVAPFWDDLYPIRNTQQNVFWDVVGAAPNRELVVEWRDVRSFDCRNDANTTVRFQVVFHEGSSDVEFQYADVTFGGSCSVHDRGGSATVGIQISPQKGTLWGVGAGFIGSNGETVSDGLALDWKIPMAAPVTNPVPSLTGLSPVSAVRYGPDFTLTVNGTNFVPTSRVIWNGYLRATTFVSGTQLMAFISTYDLGVYGTSLATINVANPSPGGGWSNSLPFTVDNPAPIISSITPDRAFENGFSLSLHVMGSGFTNTSTLRWNGSDLETYFASPTDLYASVYNSHLVAQGTAQIVVLNKTPGGGTSNAVTFTIEPRSTGQPATQLAIAVSGDPDHSATPPPLPGESLRFRGWKDAMSRGDEFLRRFSRTRARTALTSKLQDLPAPLLAAQSTSGNISPPGFETHSSLPADFIPTCVAAGDFNRDGRVDWVVSNGGSDTLWVYLGRGDGTSELPRILALNGISPLWVETADLRGNGVLDLIVAEVDTGTVGVLLGNGDGTFGDETLYFLPTPTVQVAVGDFNLDGHVDVLAAMIGPPQYGPAAFLPGDGTGRLGLPVFSPGTNYYFNIQWMETGDIDNDGDLDLIVIDYAVLQGVVAFSNNGDGTFKLSQVIGHGSGGFVSARLGDLNEDGCADLVVTAGYGVVWVFPGRCDGTFGVLDTARVYGNGDVGFGIALRDLNGDGHLDLVTSGFLLGNTGPFGQEAGNLVSVLFGDGLGHLNRARMYRGDPSLFGLVTADLNGDGRLDVLTTSEDADSVGVFLNDGSGGFGGGEGLHIGYIAHGDSSGGSINTPYGKFLAADVDGDGDRDLLVMQYGRVLPEPGKLAVMKNDGTGRFSSPFRTSAFEHLELVQDFVVGDFRNVGLLDVIGVGRGIASSSDISYLTYARNRGDGTFADSPVLRQPDLQGLLGTGDFNRDGKLDFVTAHSIIGIQRLTVFLGNGDASFVRSSSVDFGNPVNSTVYPVAVHVGDFNGDSKLDVLVHTSGNGGWIDYADFFEFLGNGDGTFAAPRVLFPHIDPFAVADVNEDGRPDLIEARPAIADYPLPYARVYFAIHLGQPDGTFLLAHTYDQTYAGGQFLPRVYEPMVADFNGDGHVDIAAWQRVRAFPSFAYLQILAGNGDGTFTPTNAAFELNKVFSPQQAIDLNGDGRADLVELDQWASSFNIVRAKPGPFLQVRLVSEPVVGSVGTARITLNVPQASATAVTLSTSDPGISIATSATIPAGASTVDVPFQISSAYDWHAVFAVTAQAGGDNALAYGTLAAPGAPVGFRIVGQTNPPGILPGQTTQDYGPGAISLGGYASTVHWECLGLPASASCQFGANQTVLPSGGYLSIPLVISTSANTPIGSHPFTIRATDGSSTQDLATKLNVGDFALKITPAAQSIVSSGYAFYTLEVTGTNDFYSTLKATCTGLPAGATCEVPPYVAPFSYSFLVRGESAAVGSYSFTVTATSLDDLVSRSATAQLNIGDFAVTPPSSSSATLSAGQSARFSYTLNSQNGFSDQFTFLCLNAPQGVSCAFAPASGSLPANGSLSTELTVTVTSLATGQMPLVRFDTLRPMPLPYGVLLAIMAALLLARLWLAQQRGDLRSRKEQAIWALPVLILLIAGLVSCGGGGGGGGSSPPPPGPQPVTVTLPIQAQSPSLTKQIGTVTITVP